MNAVVVAAVALALFLVGYRFYGKFISDELFELGGGDATPAHSLRDDVDYVPTNRWILFGHHFASISGLGPILGPAIAVIWGWLPALLWIVFGSLLIGGIHDLTTLGLSVRRGGRSIGDVSAKIINERSRLLFLVLTLFLITLAMGVFAHVVAVLFASLYPRSVIPVFSLILIAMGMGTAVKRGWASLAPATVVGILLLVVSFGFGARVPVRGIGTTEWTVILLVYAFLASVLPVWFLLQPRDYLNSFLLYAGLISLYAGLIWMQPEISAPALNVGAAAPGDLPPLFPVLFITVACGAISGFHSLISSGTTAKQIDREEDAQFVAYGGMVAEGVLALIVVLACVAALGNLESWRGHYGSWTGAKGLATQLNAFINGGSNLLTSYGKYFGLTDRVAGTFISLIAVSFAMTTLDSGTRLLRYNLEELSEALSAADEGFGFVNRWTASLAAVAGIGFFALLEVNGDPAGIFLWVLFGATNQIFAALGLLAVTVYLFKRSKPVVYTLLPMLFMIVVTTAALSRQLLHHLPLVARRLLNETLALNLSLEAPGSWVIFLVALAVAGLALWLVVESILVYLRHRSETTSSR